MYEVRARVVTRILIPGAFLLGAVSGCGSSGNTEGGGGAGAGGSAGATGGAGGSGNTAGVSGAGGSLSVTVTSASVTGSLSFSGADLLCMYSSITGEPSLSFHGQNQFPDSFLLSFAGITLTPHQQQDTFDPVTTSNNRMVMTFTGGGYEYWWFNDYTAATPSRCSTDFVTLDSTTVAGSTTCQDLVPMQGSLDYSGIIENPGPHASATISFQCPIQGG